jgi:hypothetical protein
MPRVTVILDNGHEVVVEGANFAEWLPQVTLVTGGEAGSIARRAFEVVYKAQNERKVLGRFDSSKVLGYTIDEL